MKLRRVVSPALLLLGPALAASFPVLFASACSSSASGGAAAASGPVARFVLKDAAPGFLDVPFPSDVYLQNGRVVAPPAMENVIRQNAKFVAHELPRLDGFSRVALALFYVDDPTAPPNDDDGSVAAAMIDPSSLPAGDKACVADDSSVYLVDLDAADAGAARIACRAVPRDDRPMSKTRPVLAIGPARGVVLEEAHHYAAVMTSRVKDKQGRAVAASSDFATATNNASSLYGAAFSKVRAALAGALAKDGAKIVSLAPYTTNAMTKELFALRDGIASTPVPALRFDAASLAPMGATKFASVASGQAPAGFTATLDAYLGVATAKLPNGDDDPDTSLPVRAHNAIDVIATGAFDAVNYLQVKPGGYGDLDHATFARDANGTIVPAPEKPTDKVWVTIALPKAPMPPSGYPVVVIQHGIDGSREYVLELANVFAAKGWAVVGIDSVTFGARAAEPQWHADARTDYEHAPGATYVGPDGINDQVMNARNGSGDLFGNLLNLGAIRDQFRQAAIDTAQLIKVIQSNPDLSPIAQPGTTPKFDGSSIVYLGNSLGAIQGSVAAAIEPSVKAWTLNVTGGGLLIELAAHSPAIGTSLRMAGGVNFGFLLDEFNEGHVITNVIQTIADAGDPLNYARYLLASPHPLAGAASKPRNLLATEVVNDEIVPNEANEALARAGGYLFGTPNVGSNAGIADIKNIANNPWRVPMGSVDPDANGVIHDTPKQGVTAVLMQVSPGVHGDELTSSKGRRRFQIPFGRYTTSDPFPALDDAKQYDVPCPYREVQAATVRFFGEALAGSLPGVQAIKAPVRDTDADGAMDDVDRDPNDPKVQ